MTKSCPFTGFNPCKKEECGFFFIDGDKSPNCMIISTWEKSLTHKVQTTWIALLLAKHGISIPASPAISLLKESPDFLTDCQEAIDQSQVELDGLRQVLKSLR